MKTVFLFIIMFLVYMPKGISQVITLQDNRTAMQLVNNFLGTGVTVTSATLTCDPLSNGTFSNTNTSILSLTLDAGSVLTTGRVKTAPKPTSGFFIGIDSTKASVPNNDLGLTATDPQIATVATTGATQRDVCKLEFVFIPQGDSLYLDYVFSSEEYPSYRCTQYGDVFGIFVKPTSSSTYVNYANVPGTNPPIPVKVNSINQGIGGSPAVSNPTFCTSLGTGMPNTALYVDNLIANHVSYNGMTKILKARVPVTPNATHNGKIVIADIYDGFYDSGVFLKSNSMVSYPLLKIIDKKSTGGANSNPLYLIEGCDSGIVTFQRSANSSPLSMTASFAGNATFPADFSALSNFTIPAGDTIYNYSIKALMDAITEPNDSVVITLNAASIGFSQSVVFKIKDYASGISVYNATNDTTVCHGANVPLRASSSDTIFKILWNPATNLSCTNCTNPIFTATNGNNFGTKIVNLRITSPGCPIVDSPVTINIQPNPVLSMSSPTTYSCKNDSIVLNPNLSPVSSLYTYSWATNSTLTPNNILNPVAKPLSTQTYTLTVTTSAGCSATASQTVSVSDIRAEIDSMRTSMATCGLNNGSLNLYVTASTPYLPPYFYSINGGTSFSTISAYNSLSNGVYNVAIKNVYGCRFDTTIIVPSAGSPPTFTFSQINTTCGLNNGSAKLDTKTGNGPFTYQWKLGATVISNDTFINNKAAGVYTFIVTDVNGCTSTQLVSILNSSPVTIGYNTVHQSCNLPNGSIIAFPSGGVFPYTYAWNITPNPGNVNNISGLVAGKYKITVTDNVGCVKIDSVFLVNSAPPGLFMFSTVASCSSFTGTATVSIVSGGNPNYSYNWSNGTSTAPISNTSHTVTGLAPGKYYVTVTDSKGCISNDSVTVLGTYKPSVVLLGTNINCSSNNGTITTTTTGGQPGYSYVWNDGSFLQNRTNLAAAIYTVTVSDGNGCTASQSVNIAINSNPILSLTKKNSTCGLNNGNVVVQLANARPPITYQWSNGSTANFINNLTNGKYIVTVTDSFGCQKIDSAVVDSIAILNFTHSKIDTRCDSINGSITISNLTGISPFKFTWSDGSTLSSRTNLAAGNYNLFVEDSNKCSKTISVNIASSAKLSLIVSKQDALCKDTVGSITTTMNSGQYPIRYLWSSGDTTANIINKPPGTYTLTAFDNFNCPFTYSGTIVRKASPTYTKTIVNPTCGYSNGSITLNNVKGIQPLNYFWSNIGLTFTPINPNLDTGTYTLTIVDINNCQVLDTFKLISLLEPKINFTYQRPNCNDSNGYIKAKIIGGNPKFIFNWKRNLDTLSNHTDSIYGLKHDRYSLEIIDSLGCVSFKSIDLKNITNLRSFIYDTATRCDTVTGRVRAVADSGKAPYMYIWTKYNKKDTSDYIDSLSVGQYKLRIIDSNKCILDTFVNIEYDHYPAIVVDSAKHPTCGLSNGLLRIKVNDATSPLIIYWNNSLDPTLLKTGLSSGFNSIRIEDSFKCVGSLDFEMIAVRVITATNTPDNAHCGVSNGKITINVDPIGILKKYLWSNGDTVATRTNLNTGTYKYTVTDVNQCEVIDSVSLINTNFPQAVFSVNHSQCGRNDGSITTTITTPYAVNIYQWSNGANGANLTSLSPGKYKVTIEDEFGCIKIDSVTINNIPGPTINFNIHNTKCINGNGSIKAIVTNALFGLNYQWFNFNNTDSVSNLNDGEYYLTVTDGRGCQVIDTATIIYYSQPVLTLTGLNANCGGGNGAVFSNISLGTAPFKYLWSNGDTTSNALNLYSGKYKVTLTDSVGCGKIDSLTILSTPKPIITSVKTDANCNLSNGKAKATISSGKSPFIYNWDNIITSDSIVGLDSGRHIFTVIDSNLCESKDTVFIARIPIPDIQFLVTNDNCTYKVGSILTTITGGKPPFNFNWNGGLGSNKNLLNIGAGNYTLNLIDTLGCAVSKTVNISDTAGPVVSLNVIQATCGLFNGSINANVSSIRTPLSFFYNDIPRNKDTSGLNGAVFILKTIDSRGCIKRDTAYLDTVQILNYTKNVVDATCGLNNGTIKLKPTGGTGPYNFIWNSSAVTIDSLGNLSAGTYLFTISDSKGCLKSDSIKIVQKGIPSIVFDTFISSKCSGNNGSVSSIVTSGVSPYTYNWGVAGQTNYKLTNVLSGSYILTITDASNCTVTNSVYIPNRGITAVTLNVDEPKCNTNNGKIKTSLTNQVNPVTYTWSNSLTTDSIQNLAPGVYSLIVKDSLNCTVTASKTLVNQKSPEIALSTFKANCDINNGKVFSNINYGTTPFNFLWNNTSPAQNIVNLDSGTYSLTVTDALGCMDTATAYVARSTMLKVTHSTVKSICGEANGSITTNITGGTPSYTLQWSNGENTPNIANKLPGNYTLTVVDIDLCQVVSNVMIDDFSKPKITTKIIADAVCGKGNGSVTTSIANGTKPFTYLWNTGSTLDTLNNLFPGIYSIKVTDSMNCTDSAIFSIASGAPPYLVLNAYNAKCEKPNGLAVAELKRGVDPIKYTWSNGDLNDSLINVIAGKYFVSIKDGRDCEVFDSVVIAGTLNPTLSFTTDNSYCLKANGNAYTTVTSGTSPFIYLWSNNTTNKDLTNVVSKSYTLTVTDNVGCTVSQNVTINEDPNTLTANYTKQDLKCFNDNSGTITVNAKGGNGPYQYQSTIPGFVTNSTLGGLNAGKNSFTVMDSKGCLFFDTFSLIQPSQIVVDTVKTKDILCHGDATGFIEISAKGGTPGYKYSWDKSSSKFSLATNLIAGQHIVTVRDLNNCAMPKTIVLKEPTEILVLDSIKNPNCFGYKDGKIKINVSDATPPYQYLWSRKDTTKNLDSVSVGNYTLSIIDNNSCIDSFKYKIIQPTNIQLANIEIKDHTCKGTEDGEITLEALGGTGTKYMFSIDSGNTFSYQKKYTLLGSGKYHIVVRDVNNCRQDTSLTIGSYKEFSIAAFPKESTIKLGESIQIDYDVTKGSFSQVSANIWSPSIGLSCLECKQTLATPYSNQKYIIRVDYNDFKCITYDTVIVHILDDLEIYVPTAFSPNNQGETGNEILYVYGQHLIEAHIQIFNRWGEKVFENLNGHRNGWNGIYNGEPASLGVYTYSLKATLLNKKVIEKKGSITLVR